MSHQHSDGQGINQIQEHIDKTLTDRWSFRTWDGAMNLRTVLGTEPSLGNIPAPATIKKTNSGTPGWHPGQQKTGFMQQTPRAQL